MGRMPMMPRFRLPVSQEYAESCLAMAVAAEVESRGHSISPDGDFEQCVRQTAAWTVNASPRHSLLLAGRYGNGKTTFLRALQSLVNAFDLRDPMTGKRMRLPLYNAVHSPRCTARRSPNGTTWRAHRCSPSTTWARSRAR